MHNTPPPLPPIGNRDNSTPDPLPPLPPVSQRLRDRRRTNVRSFWRGIFRTTYMLSGGVLGTVLGFATLGLMYPDQFGWSAITDRLPTNNLGNGTEPNPLPPPFVPQPLPPDGRPPREKPDPNPHARRPHIEQLLESVAIVRTKHAAGRGMGSAFVVDQHGTIATNYHVIENAWDATLTFHDKSEARVVGVVGLDPGRDLALLRADRVPRSARRPLRLTRELPPLGERVLAFGAPQGFAFAISEGIVSSIRTGAELREFFLERNQEDDVAHLDIATTWIQVTTPIAPGNSGGPLVNDRGEVVGIVSWYLSGGPNLTFAVSALDLTELLKATDASQKPQPLPGPRPDVKEPHKRPENAATRQPYSSSAESPPKQDTRRSEFDRITLPSGAILTESDINLTDFEWDQAFAEDAPKFQHFYKTGQVAVIVCHGDGLLHGGAASFYESGKPKAFVVYSRGRRDGVVRLWNEDGDLILYGTYRVNRKDGLLCFFIDGIPVLVQEHDKGIPQGEYLAQWSEDSWVVIDAELAETDDAQNARLNEAREALALLEAEMEQGERELKQAVRKVYDEEKRERLKEERGPRARERHEQRRAREAAQHAAALEAINKARQEFLKRMQPYQYRLRLR